MPASRFRGILFVMGEKIICPSCGAEFESNKVKCPFCGTIYLKAAEAEYMDKLEDVKEDLDDLKDSPKEETKGQFKKIWKWLIVLLAVFMVIGAAVLINDEMRRKRYEEEDRQEYLWRSKNYPVMNELYDKGEYEQLLDIYDRANKEGHNLYNFPHNDFCVCLRDIVTAGKVLDRYKNNETTVEELLHRELYLFRLDTYKSITEEEYKILDEMRKPYLDDFYKRFDMSGEELDKFISQLKNGQYISYSDCTEYIEKKGLK